MKAKRNTKLRSSGGLFSKIVRAKKLSSDTPKDFQHQFRVVSAEEVNQQRSSAYQYLSL